MSASQRVCLIARFTLLALQAQPHFEQAFRQCIPEIAVSEMELRGTRKMPIALAWPQAVCSSSSVTSTVGYPTVRHST